MQCFRGFSVAMALLFALASCQPPVEQATSPSLAAAWAGPKKMRELGSTPSSIRVSPGLRTKSLVTGQAARAFSTQSVTLFDPAKGINLLHPTGKQHGKDDRPYFDPANPASLGNVTVVDNDLVHGDRTASFVAVNGGHPIIIEAGALLVLPLPPASSAIDAIRARYQIQEIEPVGSFYRIKFDLANVGLSRLPELLTTINQFNEQPIQSMELSSLNAAKTVVLAAELMTGFPQHVAFAGYNVAAPTPTHGAAGLGPDDYVGHFDAYSDRDIKPSGWGSFTTQWWLKEMGSNVENAWSYGMGGGVRVGYVDRGFELIGNKDFDRRIDQVLARDFNSHPYQVGLFNHEDWSANDEIHWWHGTYGMSAGFAERDDGTGISGAAPNATLIPANAVYVDEYAKAIRHGLDNDVDLIVLNMAWDVEQHLWWAFFIPVLQIIPVLWSIGTAVSLMPVEEQVAKADKANVPIIVAAHNWNKDARNVSPCNMGDRNNVICVGAIEAREDTSGPPGSPPKILTYAKANYSNFGDRVTVWAPSNGSLDFGADKDRNAVGVYAGPRPTGPNRPSQEAFGGTSFATPFVGGIATLVIGAAKRLKGHTFRFDAGALKEALKASDPSDMRKQVNFNGATLPMVDAKQAVEKGLQLAGITDPRQAVAKKFCGEVSALGNNSYNYPEYLLTCSTASYPLLATTWGGPFAKGADFDSIAASHTQVPVVGWQLAAGFQVPTGGTPLLEAALIDPSPCPTPTPSPSPSPSSSASASPSPSPTAPTCPACPPGSGWYCGWVIDPKDATLLTGWRSFPGCAQCGNGRFLKSDQTCGK